MDYKEIIPFKALRKFDAMCLHNEYLHLNKEMQQQILSWAADMLKEARAEWSERRNDTIRIYYRMSHAFGSQTKIRH